MSAAPTRQAASIPISIVIVMAVSCAAAPDARACEPSAFDLDAYLSQNDSNHDGSLTLPELLAAPAGVDGAYGATLDVPVNTRDAFGALDADRDGRLSSDELWQRGSRVHDACAGWPHQDASQSWWARMWTHLKTLLARWLG